MRSLNPATSLHDRHGARMPRGLVLLLISVSFHPESARGAFQPACRPSGERGVLAWT